jgi:hypothetical protein
MDHGAGARRKLLPYSFRTDSARLVAIEQDDDPTGVVKVKELLRGNVAAEESNCGDMDLGEAKHGPGTLHEDDAVGRNEACHPVEVVEHRRAGQLQRQLPFPQPRCLVGVESTAGVTEGKSPRIIETDADAAFEETWTMVATDLETVGSLGPNALDAKQVGVRIEAETPGVGLKE